MTAKWWSQRFAPEGSAAAEGIAKQLGVPALDALTILVREAAQNSWDAKRCDGVPLQFRISIRQLGDRYTAWRRHLLPAPDSRSSIDLDGHLDPNTTLLIVSDRGTVGLGGPLRAGHRATGPEPPDFVQFIRNVGEPSDHEFGGGTYGFGKGIFFRLSTAATIVVDTHTASPGPYTRRLMGAALGQSWYDDNDLRYTGRHWWGMVDDDVPDPLTDSDADQVAHELGLPGFADGRTGTDIVVVAADLGTSWGNEDGTARTRKEAAAYIISSMLWNLWPKFIAHDDYPAMAFFVDVDGTDIPVPRPESIQDIAPFAAALRRLNAGQGHTQTRSILPRVVGSISHELVAASAASDLDPIVSLARPFVGPSHHVARMRTAELVVDYVPGPQHPDPLLGYAAVFKASRDADGYFAGAEPPTHDDWVEKGLTGTARGVVQSARRFVMKQLEESITLTPLAGDQSTVALGQFAQRLSTLVPGGIVTTARPSADDRDHDTSVTGSGTTPAGGEGHPGKPLTAMRSIRRPRLVGTPKLEIADGRGLLVAQVEVPLYARPRRIKAEARVVLDGGGIETEPPAGARSPSILYWRSVEHGTTSYDAILHVPAGHGGDWCVYAMAVPDAVVRFSIQLDGGTDGE